MFVTQMQWTHPWDEYALDLIPPHQLFQPWEDQPLPKGYRPQEEAEGVMDSISGQSLTITADIKVTSVEIVHSRPGTALELLNKLSSEEEGATLEGAIGVAM